MNRIDDPRLKFYLRHQDLIDEWAGMADEVSKAAHEFYLSVADDLEVEAEQLGGDVLVAREDGQWGRAGLYRESWMNEAVPLAVVTLEWNRAKSVFSSGWRVCGVRCPQDIEGGVELRPAVAELVQSERASLGYPKSSSWWPAYRHLPGPTTPEYWEDLTPFREALVAAVMDAWEKLSPFVDEGVAGG